MLLLLAAAWLMTRRDGHGEAGETEQQAAPVDGAHAEPRPSPPPEPPTTEATAPAPLAVPSRRRFAEQRAPLGPEPTLDDTGEVELAPFQLRTLERTKHDLVTLLRDDLALGVESCAETKLDEPPQGELELYFELGPHRGEARVESVSYGEDSDVDDPRLLECLHELTDGEVIPAELLDELEDGVVRVRLGPFRARDDAEGPQARPRRSP